VNDSFKKIQDYLFRQFSFDLRALGLMRMGIAILLMLDLVIRAGSLVAHYTDEGVLPLDVLYNSNWNPSFFSVYCIGTGWKVIASVFIINFFFALLLFFGFKTRFVTVVCWFFLVSLHNRNPIILQGGDEMLRLLLFWGIFMPWGKRYSVDNLLAVRENGIAGPGGRSWFNIGGLGYLVLLFCVYFFSALLKESGEWRREGTALYYALSLDQMAWPAGKAIYQFPGLLKFLTLYTFYLELLGPLLLFIPVKSSYARIAFIFLFFTLHLGIAFTLYVGLFYLIGMVSLLALLPGSVLDRMENWKWSRKLRSFFLRVFSFFARSIAGKVVFKMNISLNLNENIRYQLKLLSGGLLFFIVCYNVLWCLGRLPHSKLKVNENFLWIGYTLRLDQNWGMFAPSVYKDDGWYIYEAKTADGKLIDLNRDGKPVDYTKPESIIALYENDRWRKFGEIWQLQPENVKIELCRYLKNKWNKKHPANLVQSLKIVYMKETTLPDYKPSVPVRTVQSVCR
jgi:hypothetical protein